MVCTFPIVYVVRWGVCSAHMTHVGVTVAAWQVGESITWLKNNVFNPYPAYQVWYFLDSNIAAVRTWTLGGGYMMGAAYSEMYEACGGTSGGATHGSAKIDYVFARHSANPDPCYLHTIGSSDHKMLTAQHG